MFLKKARKTYKGKVYETYALTESYRENGKVKHRHIANLGSLSQEQAQRIRLVLQAKQIGDAFVGRLSDVVAKEHYRFLDVAVLDDLWQQFTLDQFFKDLPYAEAMVINRCIAPRSKIRIQDWTRHTILPRLMEFDFSTESEYSVYRTLDKIADLEQELQQHIYRKSSELGHMNERAIFYDITSSYFEGTKCILASGGYSRDHRPDRLQITVGLVVTPDGYPFYWQVMPGNTQDITTVEGLLLALEERFGIKECLLVFDRGMVSRDNLKAIAEKKLSYISALDKNEIPVDELLDNDFKSLVDDEGRWQENLLSRGFQPYDENLFYREHSLKDIRYILAFNHQTFQDQRSNRERQLQKAKSYLEKLNQELLHAKKSRKEATTSRKIENQLQKWKLHKIFKWHLEPQTRTVTIKKGKKREVNTFKVLYALDQEQLQKQALLHGIACFITNQPKDKLPAQKAIQYYRRKNKVEEAFRELKNYLHMRPFYLQREKRVRAHITVCVLGYLLLNALEDRLSQQNSINSAPEALETLGGCLINRIGLKKDKTYSESITEVTLDQEKILEKLGLKHLISNKYLNNILEHSSM